MLSLLPPQSSIEPIPLAKDIIYKDFCHIIGHEQAKRALEIAAAGEHNVLMSGPPGCGKSLLAESFPSILPAITTEAQLEVMSLYQLAKRRLPLNKLFLSGIPITRRPQSRSLVMAPTRSLEKYH
jgi:magnesium chelatase family protein